MGCRRRRPEHGGRGSGRSDQRLDRGLVYVLRRDYTYGPFTPAYRWNGASWVGSATLGPTGHDGFQGVVAIGSGDVWAVGTTSATSTLTEHFDGTSWSQATSASPGNPGNVLAAAAAAASTDVWAVGSSLNYANGTFTRSTLIERFTG